MNNRFVFRSVTKQDAYSIFQLSKLSKSGLTNIPKTYRDSKIKCSEIDAYFQSNDINRHPQFLFALESDNQNIVGISGVKTRTGIHRPYYSYHYKKNTQYPYLELSTRHMGPSEIESIFIAGLSIQ